MIHTRAFAPALLAAALFLGCAPKEQTTLESPPPDSTPQPQLAADIRARVQQVVTLAQQYAENAGKLPGPDEMQDRARVADQFAILSQLLPALNGPEMTGDFRQQLRIVESTRALLTSSSQDLAAEPTIDAGVRAAHRALASINQRNFTGLPDVAKSLDGMRDRVLELDSVAGPIHRLVVGQAFQAASPGVTMMADALHQRLNDVQGGKAPAPAPTNTSTPAPEKAAPAPTPETAKPVAPPETAKPAERPKPAAPPETAKPAEQPKPAVPELNK